MKNLFYLYFISSLLFASCDEAISIDEEVIPTPIPDDKNTPSDYDFSTLQANDTLNIAYTHDLGGKSIEVPSNVVINYNKGEIVNGSLVFKEAKIDGKLLNHKLIIQGTPSLTSSTFKFEKSKWEITEGEVLDAVALINKETLQKVIEDVKSYGAETFQIDELDAYFLISSERNLIVAHETAIKIPSDFTLEMSDNTHLRVQANKYIRYQLIDIRGVENVNLKGGNLHGDRDYHDYSSINSTHEWGHLIDIATGSNITIENVLLRDGSGDGINIHSIYHTFRPEYIGSNNIKITGCIFDSNRRNNLSITDGNGIIVEKNTFDNAGIDTPYSEGTAPRCAIDVEAHREREREGELIYYQRAKNIIIRDNIEKNGARGAFLVSIGEDVLIENNTTENSIGFRVGTRVKIRKNKIKVGERKITAIVVGKSSYSDAIYGNEVSDNTIEGHSIGIHVLSQDISVFGNMIKDCGMGIFMRDLKDAEIYENIIRSDKVKSYGIRGFGGVIDNLTVRDNDIDVIYPPISFSWVNSKDADANNSVLIKNNDLKGRSVSIDNSNGIVVE